MSEPDLTRDELLRVAVLLAGMIEEEWPGPLSYVVCTWGGGTDADRELIDRFDTVCLGHSLDR